MKLAAIIVLYNPESLGLYNLIRNISSYSSRCERIFLIDNSLNDNSYLLKYFNNATYLSNKNLNGIAGAQNLGCSKAIEDGFEWVITMDQDSIFEYNELDKYLRTSDKIIHNKNIKSITLNINQLFSKLPFHKYIQFNILSPLKRKLLKNKWTPRPVPEFTFVRKCIASGNIINLNAWKIAGGFDETLFIDEVDYDFCYKLTKCGYKIAKIENSSLIHPLGEKHFSILPRTLPYHNDFRMYYIFRNHFIMMSRYKNLKKEYTKTLLRWIYNSCINTIHPIKHFKILIKAHRDYLKYQENY